MKTIKTIKSQFSFDIFPRYNLITFLLQDNSILLRLESLKEELVFRALSFVLKRRQDRFSPFSP